MNTVKKVSIFGVTGSVGQSTADLILSNPEQFDVKVVTAGNNFQKLAKAAKELNAEHAVIANEDFFDVILMEKANNKVLLLFYFLFQNYHSL